MVKITYIEPGGKEQAIETGPGVSLMEAAVKNGIEGIIAECGGLCSCGTCRVYIDDPWKSRLADMAGHEADMIEYCDDPNPNLRLSCQIPITEELEGLVATVADSQT